MFNLSFFPEYSKNSKTKNFQVIIPDSFFFLNYKIQTCKLPLIDGEEETCFRSRNHIILTIDRGKRSARDSLSLEKSKGIVFFFFLGREQKNGESRGRGGGGGEGDVGG